VRTDFGKKLAQHHRRRHVKPFGDGLGADLPRRYSQQTFGAKDLLDLGNERQPPRHQAYKDRHDAGQRQESLTHADEPVRLPLIAAFKLAWGQQRCTEHVQQPLFHVDHRGQGGLPAVPKIRMDPISRLLVRHGPGNTAWVERRETAVVGIAGLTTDDQDGTPEHGRHHNRREVEPNLIHAVVVRKW
jgi:hypothetical protein